METKTVEAKGTEYRFEKEEYEEGILAEVGGHYENDDAPAEAHIVLEEEEDATSGAAQLAREKLAERLSEKYHGIRTDLALGRAEWFDVGDDWEVIEDARVEAQGVKFPAAVFRRTE